MSVMDKLASRLRRKVRIRAKVEGSADRPRLSVYISNSHVRAQVIDDQKRKTLVASDSKKASVKGSLSTKAEWVGNDIATKAKKAKIGKVVFDRNGRKYHGRIKTLADAARDAGLEF